MRVLIDGDAFPNIKDIINIAVKYNRETIIYIDTSHEMNYKDAKTVKVSPGANAADLVLENNIKKGDIVLTQDYGVAIIALSKQAICINQLGKFYTNNNIDYLMEVKNLNYKLRKHANIKGPKKRTNKDKERLLFEVENILKGVNYE